MADNFVAHKRSSLASPGMTNWIQWVIANIIGGTVGWTFTTLSMMSTLGLTLFLSWLIVGPCVAGAQYVVISKRVSGFQLNKRLPAPAAIWIMTGPLGMLICFICRIEMPDLLYRTLANTSWDLDLSEDKIWLVTTFLGFAVGGLLYGAIQGLILSNLRRLASWCFLCALGWGVGATLGTQTAQVVMNLLRGGQFELASGYVIGPFDALYFAFAGISGTSIFGIITGIFVSRLPAQAPSHTASRAK